MNLKSQMSEQEFSNVIDAIINGKYSWACVLVLQSAGYNPLHYIPYRTYNRLIKSNLKATQENSVEACRSNHRLANASQKTKFVDLHHVSLATESQKVKGKGLRSFFDFWTV